MEGLIHTGIIASKTEIADGYGGVSSESSSIITGWKCRISEDYSVYAREARGRGGRESFNVVGEDNSTSISRGDVLTISAISYDVMEVSHRNNGVGSHHWFLRVEKIT